MKGVVHYFIAAAAASLIPMVMELSIYEKAFVILFAAIAGILPDYIDFKLVRFFWRVDEEIIPDWPIPDTKKIARRVAELIDKAWNEKRTINVQFHTIKVGPSTWRRWYVHLNPDKKKVIVGVGPIQTFGGRDFLSTVEDIPPEMRVGEASFEAPLKYDYKDRTIKVSILVGPMVAFKPKEDKIEVVFLPWHRSFSHSFTLGAFISAIFLGILLLLGWTFDIAKIYALAFFVGYASHVVSDHLGYMGSNLFWPFTKERTPGLKLAESIDPYLNFGTFWTMMAILIWQMNYSINPPPIDFSITFGELFIPAYISYPVIAVLIPWIILLTLRKYFWKPSEDPVLRNLLREELEAILG